MFFLEFNDFLSFRIRKNLSFGFRPEKVQKNGKHTGNCNETLGSLLMPIAWLCDKRASGWTPIAYIVVVFQTGQPTYHRASVDGRDSQKFQSVGNETSFNGMISTQDHS